MGCKGGERVKLVLMSVKGIQRKSTSVDSEMIDFEPKRLALILFFSLQIARGVEE